MEKNYFRRITTQSLGTRAQNDEKVKRKLTKVLNKQDGTSKIKKQEIVHWHAPAAPNNDLINKTSQNSCDIDIDQ